MTLKQHHRSLKAVSGNKISSRHHFSISDTSNAWHTSTTSPVPLLSVIVPTYNNELELENCLTALTNQKQVRLNQDYEIIVVDDASTDQTSAIINKFSVHHLTLKKNQGRVKARQIGAEVAKSHHLLFIDARVIVDSDFIAKLLLLITSNANSYPAILAGNQHLQTHQRPVAQYISNFFWLMRQVHYGQQFFPSAKYSYFINKKNFHTSPKGLGAFFITKKFWLQIQPLSPSLGKTEVSLTKPANQVSQNSQPHQSNEPHQSIQTKPTLQANDDTALLHHLVFEQNIPIWRSNKLGWTYQSRQSLASTIKWLYERGMKYTDFYLSTALQQNLIGALALITMATIWKITLPQLLFLLLAAFLTVSAYLLHHHFNLKQSAKILSLLPAASLIFGAGALMVIVKKKFKVWLSLAIMILFLQYLIQNWSSLGAITQIEAPYLFGLLPLYALFYFSNGVFIKLLINIYNTPVNLSTASSVSVISSFINTVVPMRAGTTWRAHYLKTNFQFPYAQFLLTMLANYLLVFNINSFVGLLVLLLIPIAYTQPLQWMVLFLLLGTWLLTSLALWLPVLTERANDGTLLIPEFIQRGLRGWQILQQQSKTLVYLAALALLNLVTSATIFGLELMSLGFMHNINLNTILSWLLMASVSSLSLLVSITPAALGIREGLLATTSSWLGLTPSALVTVSLLDRAVSIASLLLLAPLAWLYLNRRNLNRRYVNRR